jgi:hypothetical protein
VQSLTKNFGHLFCKVFSEAGTSSDVVRGGGIEPPSSVWKTDILAVIRTPQIFTPVIISEILLLTSIK